MNLDELWEVLDREDKRKWWFACDGTLRFTLDRASEAGQHPDDVVVLLLAHGLICDCSVRRAAFPSEDIAQWICPHCGHDGECILRSYTKVASEPKPEHTATLSEVHEDKAAQAMRLTAEYLHRKAAAT